MSSYKAECRKFQANIFNKSKCTNCFKQREEHSTDALDCNRASRKVSKCGYLFVAPDWDFTIPLYRTKRWQRRWFVLYDDGELTYSVDDLPATIPQGVIDMNRVQEVSTAEDVTGNQFSLAITAPDRVTFIKGTSREECRWWQDVLSVFPRMHKHGRHKRNATFPGIKGSSGSAGASAGVAIQNSRADSRVPNTLESPVNQRVRFHSISSDLRGARRPSSAPSLDTDQPIFGAPHKLYGPGGKTSKQYDSVNESSNGSDNSNNEDNGSARQTRLSRHQFNTSKYYDDATKTNNEKNSYYSSKINRDNSYTDSFNDSYSNSSTITPYNTSSSLQYSRSTPIPTPSLSSTSPVTAVNPSLLQHSTPLPVTSARLIRDDHKENTPPYTPEYRDNPPTSESPPTQDKQTHRLRTRRALNREARALSQPRSELQPCSVLADLEASKKREEKLKDIAASITTTSSKRRNYNHHLLTGNQKMPCSAVDKPTRDTEEAGAPHVPSATPPPTQVRGTPDGCGGTDDIPSSTLQRVDLPAEDLLYIKKGWLLKGGDNQDWNKYWFVLHGTALRFYRNSNAEDTGILDGIIDLGTAKDIHILDVTRNYGFVIKMWSEKQCILSAVTAGIRNNWVQALRNAANFRTTLQEPTSVTNAANFRTTSEALVDATTPKDALLKSTTIESVAAERDQSPCTKQPPLSYYSKTQSNGSTNNINTFDSTKNNSFAVSNGISRSNNTISSNVSSVSFDDTSKLDAKSQSSINVTSDTHVAARVTLSSDDEYKTASETSATSNLSNDNVDFYDWDGSRSRHNSGHTTTTASSKRRSHSSPPISRRATTESFPDLETSYGLSKNILERYKNMQNLTKNSSLPYTTTPVKESAGTDEVDKIADVSKQNTDYHSLNPCRKLSTELSPNVEKEVAMFRLSDSLRSLDLDSALHHEKVSSSGTLASGTGDALLVDLLETQVETLRAKLEVTQDSGTSSSQETLSTIVEPEDAGLHLTISQQQILHYKDQEEIDQLQKQILQYQKQLEISHKELEDIQNKTQEQILQYQSQLERSRNELEETQHHLQEARENAIAIQTVYSQLDQQHSMCQESLVTVRKMAQVEQEKRVLAEGDKMAACEHKMAACEHKRLIKLELDQNKERVASLQSEVEQLVEQLRLKERQLSEGSAALYALQQKHDCDRAAWRGRADSTGPPQQGAAALQEAVTRLRSSLDASEQRVAALSGQLEGRSSGTPFGSSSAVDVCNREAASLARQLSECQAEVSRLKDNVKSEKSEVYKWKDLVKELRSLLDGRNVDMDRKRDEIRSTREAMRSVQQEHEVTQDRLQRGIEENETLSAKIRELQRQLHSQEKRASSTPSMYSSREKFSSRRQLPRLDSLSDLSNVDFSIDPELLDREALTDEFCEVRARLERSISEIYALKRELRESHGAHDTLQLTHIQLTQDCAKQRQEVTAQHGLMTERLQDLTNKLAVSEKQARQLKTKMARAESKDRRRSQSLKGRDAFGLGKDVDQKLSQLEAKIQQLLPTAETSVEESSISIAGTTDTSRACEDPQPPVSSAPASSSRQLRNTKRSKSFDDPDKFAKLRRKSLESSANSDGVKAAIRINNLEEKVAALEPSRHRSPAPAGSPPGSPPTTRRSKARDGRVREQQQTQQQLTQQQQTQQQLPEPDIRLCTQLCECIEWLDTYRCSCGRGDLSALHQRLSSAHQLATSGNYLAPTTCSPLADRVQPIAQQLVHMLQQKLSSLAERRHSLKASNSWTKEAQLKNFAERIAYETVLLSQVSQALRICNQSNSNLDSVKLQDLMESHRKMAFLEKKITNPEFDLDTMAPLEFYTSMLTEKLIVTGEVIASISNNSMTTSNSKLGATCRDLEGRLLERERHMAGLIMTYKEEKLHEVALVMAQDMKSNTLQDDSVLIEEVRIREAWTAAHQILAQEIVNHQTSQSLLRITHLLNPPSDSNNVVNTNSLLSLTLCSAEAIDRIQTAAEESLRQEMEESVLTLSQKYEEVLAQYRAGDACLINSVSGTMEEVLNEFAGVMAQKALIDGHLALLHEQFEKGSLQTTQDSLIISEDTKDPVESAGDILDSESHLLMFLGGRDASIESLIKPALSHAELTFLFNKTSHDCNIEVSNLLAQVLVPKVEVTELALQASSSSYRSSTRSLQQVSPIASDKDQDILEQPQIKAANSMSKILPSPKSRRRSETRRSRRSSDVTGMTSLGCRQCEELRHELNKLKKKLQMQNTLAEEKKCSTCPKLLDTIQRLEEAQRASAARAESSDSNDQLCELKQRLLLLEEGYEAQISQLKQQYEEMLAAHPDSCDEVIRQKYQKEIEHLRGLCEKGLGTMESSQHRIVAEIKETHRRELTLLQAEKDQALAEETQATLAALDAMRKAHEAEVKREVAKIKEEFIRKMHGGQDIGELTRQHEEEMQDIRREILSLSEKFSVKCLESASLEAKIEGLNKQLGEHHRNITDLEARNSRLKTQLTDKIEAIKVGAAPGDAETELRIRMAEAVVKDEKLARMGAQLQKVQTHEGEVLEVCRHLRHYLRSDRPLLPTDQLSVVTHRLEHLMLTSPTALRDASEGQQQRQARPHLRRPKVLSSKELTRSPSCPRLGAQPQRLSCLTSADLETLSSFPPLSPSPLSGMVASRKKVFEAGDGNISPTTTCKSFL